MNAVPLARHLVPAERQPLVLMQQLQQLRQLPPQQQQLSLGGAGASTSSAGSVLTAPTPSMVNVAQHVDAPMYLGDQALYDLRPVAAKERLDLLDRAEARRCVQACLRELVMVS